MRLRPVTFRYKNDQQGIKQYGLIAEEVERVYPEMVVHDADGKVRSVRYSMLAPMLLNEVQKQARQNRQLTAQVARLTQQIGALKKKDAQIDALNERMNAVERQVRAGAAGASGERDAVGSTPGHYSCPHRFEAQSRMRSRSHPALSCDGRYDFPAPRL